MVTSDLAVRGRVVRSGKVLLVTRRTQDRTRGERRFFATAQSAAVRVRRIVRNCRKRKCSINLLFFGESTKIDKQKSKIFKEELLVLKFIAISFK